MLDTVFGEGQTGLKVFLFVIVVLALLALAFWLVRRFGGGRLGGGATRGPSSFAAIMWSISSSSADRATSWSSRISYGWPPRRGKESVRRPPTRCRERCLSAKTACGRCSRSRRRSPSLQRASNLLCAPSPERRAHRWRPKNRWCGRESGRTSRGRRRGLSLRFRRVSASRARPIRSLNSRTNCRACPGWASLPSNAACRGCNRRRRLLQARPIPRSRRRPIRISPIWHNGSKPRFGAPERAAPETPASPRLDTTLRRPLKPDDLRPWAGAGKNEPAGPGTDEATADPAKAARARSADAKPAPQKSFYDSLEQEMASLLNRPPPKP